MTEQEAYQEHIRYTHDTYCRIVIRHASFDATMCFFAFNIYSHSVATNAKTRKL